MCYDSHTLSAYLDGELSRQESQTVRSHLSDCTICSDKLLSLKQIKEKLLKINDPIYDESMDRVWRRLLTARSRMNQISLFKRTVAIPVPVLGFVSFIIFVLCFVLVSGIARNNIGMMRITTEPSGLIEVQVSAHIKDLEVLLKSLENQNSMREAIIQLPKNSDFSVLGEPVLLRAKDLSRSSIR